MERYKVTLSPLFQDQARVALMDLGNWQEKTEQNCRYRLDWTTPQGWVRVKQFTNGTFYLEATDASAYLQVLSKIQALTGQCVAPATPASTLNTNHSNKGKVTSIRSETRGLIALDVPYIGTDESGKGDYFGPLVIAGVYTTPENTEALLQLGVMDSKLLKDGQMAQIAVAIQNLVGPTGFDIIEIGPKRYNELYDKFKQSGKNLNHLLAWGHARVLENLLSKNPNCTHAIADQFGSEHYIKTQLQTRGKGIELHQTPKAEANLGVAAASILARVRFVQKLKALGHQYNTDLPPGAGSQVLTRAKSLVATYGPDILSQIAKLHFKTTETVCNKT